MGSRGPVLSHARAARGARRVARRRRRGVAATGQVVAAEPRSLIDLRGVGPELAKKFAALDIRTPRDLAQTYPRDYKDWRTPTPIAEIVRTTLARAHDPADADSAEEIALGRIVRVGEFRGRVPIVSADVADETGTIKATWFGRRGLAGKLVPGTRVFVHGRAALKRTRGSLGVELSVLHHRLLEEDEPYVGTVVPVYRASKDVSSRTIATTIERNVDALASFVHDVIPLDVLRARGYGTLGEAWRVAHRPP
ncbi:MAG: hypothetical protein IAI48_09600, partial [Candidatus Eremiobacteraeota bacterium]|nr:hypothetical protein [Candidatus Eremiobacteraeota bacterium]